MIDTIANVLLLLLLFVSVAVCATLFTFFPLFLLMQCEEEADNENS